LAAFPGLNASRLEICQNPAQVKIMSIVLTELWERACSRLSAWRVATKLAPRCWLAGLCLSLGLAISIHAAPLVGRMDGNVYVSPTGEFTITSPTLPELGGTITDTDRVVIFNDSYNIHVSIACFPLDATQRWENETRGRRDYLLYFFTTFVLADFQKRYPGSRIESARFLPELHDGTLVTFALLPGGSNFENKNRVLDAPPANPVVAKRGTLLMVRNRHIYIVSTEQAERATQRSSYQLTPDEENLRLTERLLSLLKQMEFTSAKPKS
jgi:hypothetical protein